MIEHLAGFGDDVVAYTCHGRLTRTDYTEVLTDIEVRVHRHAKLRMYCAIGSDYAGSGADWVWQDWRLTFATWFRWERGAVVTDVTWMLWATRFVGVLFPGQWRAYPTAQASAARAWITETAPEERPADTP